MEEQILSRHHYKIKRADVKGQDGFTAEIWADSADEGEQSIQRKYEFLKNLTSEEEK